MTIELGSLNLLAIIVAGITTFVIGGVWYTVLFGKTWQIAHCYSEETVKAIQTKFSPLSFFGTMIICYLVFTLTTALIIHAMGINTLADGAKLGFLIWIILACVSLTGHISTDVALAGYLIDVSYQLIYCVGTGAILGIWP